MRHISLLKLSKLTGDYFFDSKEVKQESGMSCIFIVLFFSPGRQDRTSASTNHDWRRLQVEVAGRSSTEARVRVMHQNRLLTQSLRLFSGQGWAPRAKLLDTLSHIPIRCILPPDPAIRFQRFRNPAQ